MTPFYNIKHSIVFRCKHDTCSTLNHCSTMAQDKVGLQRTELLQCQECITPSWNITVCGRKSCIEVPATCTTLGCSVPAPPRHPYNQRRSPQTSKGHVKRQTTKGSVCFLQMMQCFVCLNQGCITGDIYVWTKFTINRQSGRLGRLKQSIPQAEYTSSRGSARCLTSSTASRV